MSPPRKLRIGAVSYLNAKPLVCGLGELAPRAEIVYDLPGRLADGLAAGRLDVALIPSVEFFHNPDYRIVSDACIGCRGPVLSVKLFCRTPAAQIHSLALDEGSRTSVALVRILLKQRLGIDPRLEPLPIGASVADTRADGVLLIGDRAIHAVEEDDGFAEVWDLGEQWYWWTRLPFVFAMWAARADADLQGIDAALCEARDAGLAQLEEIAHREAAAVGMTPDECLAYLRGNLNFVLGPRQRQGLRHFYSHAANMGLVPQVFDFRFNDCESETSR